MYQAQLPHVKERVFASLLIFAFSIAMVTMTAFAWTTLSVAPEVSGATTTITANGNLEIALAGSYEIIYETDDEGNNVLDGDGNPIVKEIKAIPPGESAVGDSLLSIQQRNQTWGNLINLSDPSYGLDQIILRPTTLNTGSLSKKPFVSATYGPDGRVENDKNSDFGYTQYMEIANGKYGFLKSDIPGVKAVSSILAKPTHVESKLGLYYTKMLTETIPVQLFGESRSQLTSIVQRMDLKYVDHSPLSGLMGTYLNGMLYKTLTEAPPSDWDASKTYVPISCDQKDMQALYDLMLDLDNKVLHMAGEGFAELFYLYQMDTYINRAEYDALANPEKDFKWPETWVRFAEDAETGYLTEEGLDDFCSRYSSLIDAMNKERASDNKIPASFKTTLTSYVKIRNSLKTAISNLNRELTEGDEIYWYEVATDVNNLVNIESTQVNGKSLSSWFSSLSQNLSGLTGILNGKETDNNAVVQKGVIRDIDALLYSSEGGIKIEKISVLAEINAIKNRAGDNAWALSFAGITTDQTILANVKTNAPTTGSDGKLAPSLSTQTMIGATDTLDTGYVVYSYQALDTYGLAIDFWLRTNVPGASLILEGEVTFEEIPVTKKVVVGEEEVEVQIYLANIKQTTTEEGKDPEILDLEGIEVYKLTTGGKTVWYYADSGSEIEVEEKLYNEDQTLRATVKKEISGSPELKINKIPNGYSASNRIWDIEDLPFGVDEAKYSTSQGSGSCYTFYADPTDLNTILGVLELMRVAFVDANGNLLAVAKLDTQYCFSEYGRHLVPLVLYSGYGEQTVTDPITGEETTYRTITGLKTGDPALISALIYLEGTSIENKDVLASSDIKGQFNIQFGTTYDEEALKDEALMDEKITVSATIADKSQSGITHVKTVTVKVDGMEPNSVKANFTRKISSTQGSLYFEEDIPFIKSGDQWVCDFTFATPGTYILRSVLVDGQERLLQTPIEFIIEGLKIENLQSNLGPDYTFMTADSYVSDSFTLSIKASEGYAMPKTVKGIFTNEDNVNVDVNFVQKGTSGDWSAKLTFNASGTYTLRYLLLDGEYYEVNPFIREVVLGLKTQVWLTAPTDFAENEEYRYDRTNDVHTYFYFSKEHKFDAKLEIYDETGKEIKQLGGVGGISLIYGNITMKLKWDPIADNYAGTALTVNAPGSYAFTKVIIPMESGDQEVTASIGATRVVAATKDPYQYLGVNAPISEFVAVTNSNPQVHEYPRVDLTFKHASSASVFGKFKVVAADGSESYIVLQSQEYVQIDETSGIFSFQIPKLGDKSMFADGFYQLVEVKFTNVTDTDKTFYQSNANLASLTGSDAFDAANEESGFLSISYTEEEQAALKIKIIATIKTSVEGGKGYTTGFTGAFLEKHTLFGDGVIDVSLVDFENKPIKALGDLSLTITHSRDTMNQYYTISGNGYDSIASKLIQATLTDPDGDGVYSAELPTKEIYLAGQYSVSLKTVAASPNDPDTSLYEDKTMSAITVTSTLPTVAVTAVSPTGTGAVDTTDSNQNNSHTENHKAAAFASGYAEVYFRCSRSGSGSTCDPYRHNYSRPSVTIKLSGLGNAASAALNFGDNVHVYNGTTKTTGFAWTADGNCSRNIGYYASRTAASDTKTAAGTISASVLTLTYEGVTFTVNLSGMALKDLNGNAVTTITINNPY